MAALAFVQSKAAATATSQATLSAVFDDTLIAGNLLLACASSDNVITMTSSGWTLVASAINFTGHYQWWKIAGASESSTVTITPGSTTTAELFIEERSVTTGFVPELDVFTTSNPGSNSATITSGTTSTTTASDEYVIASFSWSDSPGTGGSLSSQTNSFVEVADLRGTDPTSMDSWLGVASKLVSATGTQETTATLAGVGGRPTGIISTYKEVVAPAINLVAQSTTPTATGSGTAAGSPLNLTYPAGIQANDMLLVVAGLKPDTATFTTPTGDGFAAPSDGTAAGGGGTTGADTGPTKAASFWKVASGSESGTLAITLGSTPNSAWGTILVFRAAAGAGATWSVTAANGIDSTTGSPFTAAMGTDPGLAVDDMVIVAGVIPTDVTTPAQFSAETLTFAGGTVTLVEHSEPETTQGNDLGGVIATGLVLTGPSSGVATFSATAGGTTTNVRGPILLVRLRATAGSSDAVTPGVASASGTAPVARAAATGGVAASAGTSEGARVAAAQGVAVGVGSSASSNVAAAANSGTATAVGVSGSGNAALDQTAGVATTAGAAQTARAATVAGMAVAAGQESAAVGLASAGVAIGLSSSQSVSAVAEIGAVSTVGSSPSSLTGAPTSAGVAVALAADPSSQLAAPSTVSVAETVGPSAASQLTAPAGVGTANSAGPDVNGAAAEVAGIASTAWTSPTVRVDASAGLASAIGPLLGITTGASSGAATTVGVDAGAAAGTSPGVASTSGGSSGSEVSVTTGLAVTVGFSPSDGSVDTTPIPGVAVGIGVTASSNASEQASVGLSTTTGSSPSPTALSSIGVAVVSGIPASSSQVAVTGVAVGQGSDHGIAVFVTTGLSTALGFDPVEGDVVVPGVAVGFGITTSSQASGIASIGVATTVGFSPLFAVPNVQITLSASSRVIIGATNSHSFRPGLITSHGVVIGLEVDHD